jgi:hypothetical protein
VPFRVEQRWRSLLDDPATRACLTALRLAAPAPARRASVVELADLLVNLLDTNPVHAQRLANVMFDPDEGTVRPPAGVERRLAALQLGPPEPGVVALAGWVATSREVDGLAGRLGRLAGDILDLPSSPNRDRLVDACRRLAAVAERFVESAPRLGCAPPFLDDFLAFVDSETIAAADALEQDPAPALVLTTPHAFLTSGRCVHRQFWLDVASPSWWEPPLLLLSNPHALSADPARLPFTIDDEERIRARVLGRMVRNLAARATSGIHALATRTGIDGELLDGPLIDALRTAGIHEGDA